MNCIIKEVDAALILLLRMVTSKKDKMWTTVDLQEQYVKDGSVLLSRRELLDCVLQAVGENFVVASILVSKAY